MHRLDHLPNVLTATMICRELGICRSTLRRMVERGDFDPPLNTGSRSCRWAKAALEKYLRLEEQEAQAVAEDDTKRQELIAMAQEINQASTWMLRELGVLA